jgi:hypothetical protein
MKTKVWIYNRFDGSSRVVKFGDFWVAREWVLNFNRTSDSNFFASIEAE